MLLRGIVTLAHRLKLKVIAEGVSTRAQYDLLAECQCDAAQGFLFARPMPASEVEALFQVRDGEDDGRQAVLF
jgi:EAL domain-containing protein (putative c-di-GMP-specific phosphodiesterase class I)